jgi:hypothetical protein
MNTLELVNGDLHLVNNNFVIIDKSQSLKQRIINRLSLFLGEYQLDSEIGIDWFTLKSRKNNTIEIQNVIRKELTKDSEITSINSVEVTLIDSSEKAIFYSKPIRTALISIFINTIYGKLTVSL